MLGWPLLRLAYFDASFVTIGVRIALLVNRIRYDASTGESSPWRIGGSREGIRGY